LADRKYLNGNIIAKEANNLINSFSYNRIDAFYAEAENMISGMKAQGADYIVFYVHWGDEYRLKESPWQKTIAQQLSNRGVNMIMGSHPHVIEPIELITPEGGGENTICLYSTGNSISNQRQELMDSCPSGHTEDGMLFSFTLKKDKDGVRLNEIDLIPTWVDKYRGGSGYQYTVYPLENADDGSTKYNLNSTAAAKAKRSYERTKNIVSAGLTQCQQYIGCDITFE
jgi:poly-gamma-glutamate synthesis protein (capsule biosynthesis protein)